MRVFFDTEFTDFSEDARLISIGFFCEDGRTFYAELSDTYEIDDCSDFVIENVLPLLEGGAAVMSMKTLRCNLSNWFNGLSSNISLYSDSVSWDGHWMREIFDGVDQPWPHNVSQTLFGVEQAITPDEPSVDSELRHHALHDARSLCFNKAFEQQQALLGDFNE